MSLMGVDVGTTGVKAVVFNGDGVPIASAYEEYPPEFPFPGACELDSANVVAAAHRVIGEAAAKAGSADPVVAIGIASQGEAFAAVAPDGRIIGNAMTSSDSRARRLVEPWTEEFGRQRLYEITGHTAYPMYSLFKLLWLRDNRPEVWQSDAKFLFFQDLVARSLTGETATDFTMAARSMLFDIAKKQWSPEILGQLGLDESRLPRLLPSGGTVGSLRPAAAAELGLSSDVKVAVCGHDQPVGALGCGAASPGHAAYSIGTVECICPAVDRLILSAELMEGNLATYPHVLPDAYTTVAFNVTGGSVLRWLRDHIAIGEASEARARGTDPYDAIISAASTEPSEMILLPHFGPTGTPHFDSYGTGVLFGLTLSSTRAEVFRAFLEGITYGMKWNLSILEGAGMKLTELRVVGGGARSDVWLQIKADILGIPLAVMRVTEATCMGAALLAGSGIGAHDPLEASSRWTAVAKTFQPRPENTGMYDERFSIYQDIYKSLESARLRLHKLKGK